MKRHRIAFVLPPALVWVASLNAGAGPETFTATATVKAAGGATATAPVTIVLERTTLPAEAESAAAALTKGGAAAFRKALAALPPAGSIQLGGKATVARLALERQTDKGRLLTVVTDQPILFLGAGVPGASAKEGFDFAVLDIEVDQKGGGSGTLSPAAKVAVKQGTFVVSDYTSEMVRLTDVKKVK